MKFIFVLIIVNVLMLNLSDTSSADIGDMNTGEDDLRLFTSRFDYKIIRQFLRRRIAIVRSWERCKKALSVPIDEAIDIFQNPPRGDERSVKRSSKCLVNCTLRRTGVMTDDGFDEVKYLMHIKQLRFNYTSFNLSDKFSKRRNFKLDTISKRASRLPSYEVRSPDFYRHFRCINMRPFRNHCYNLLVSYALAASECKNLRDAQGDDCETSWMIMRCIMEQNRIRFFDSPFYPLQLKALE